MTIATPKLEPIDGDTRFYPGWGWVSSRPDCSIGLCSRGTTREEVLENYLRSIRQRYWLRGRTMTLYVMLSPDDRPTEHRVTL